LGKFLNGLPGGGIFGFPLGLFPTRPNRAGNFKHLGFTLKHRVFHQGGIPRRKLGNTRGEHGTPRATGDPRSMDLTALPQIKFKPGLQFSNLGSPSKGFTRVVEGQGFFYSNFSPPVWGCSGGKNTPRFVPRRVYEDGRDRQDRAQW